ncbi:RraA family protein [Paraburkholderia rhizosphaerae]|uniref:Putative 4-hydroxy-4-methyl-2-oxoglutarate aldolase n=1 Tax=Paraburkholderia rhizosphaerae TaxID=480658 RepID=A0A4R8LS90_9BURK|nr:RraA family protein [Paraburkholderia rhizosphaerae]TDY50338.1 RraA family protein [Paraburkholderia rhizosphaerae]
MSQPATLGFRILPMPARISEDIIQRFQTVVTPHISDNMQRLCGVIGLKPYHHRKKLVGRAITVKVRPGDNLMIHKAIDIAEPGDVIVVDGGGEITQALVGELMQMHAQVRGVAGFVIDGAVRDVAAFYAADFPCYARGNTHRGPFKEGPGEINVPVAIGGLVIEAGDLIVGDEDGLVAVPADRLDALLAAAAAQAQRERQRKEAILKGEDKRGWIDAYLKEKGVIA